MNEPHDSSNLSLRSFSFVVEAWSTVSEVVSNTRVLRGYKDIEILHR